MLQDFEKMKISPGRMAEIVGKFALTKKAEDIVIIDLRKLSSMTDFFVVCNGSSEIQVKAIADAVKQGMKKSGIKLLHQEGYEYGRWVLLDFVDIVVHIFEKDLREFYKLESLWGDAPMVYLADESPRTDVELSIDSAHTGEIRNIEVED